MIVMKFGGTSVESRDAIARVASIVRDRLDRRPVVVVSAMGKTTNKLLSIANHAVSGHRDQALNEILILKQFHLAESGMERTVDEHFQELAELVRGLAVLGELTPRAVDAVSSFGERLSSLIVANQFEKLGLPTVHVDARKVMVTDNRHTQAAPLFAQTYERLAETIPPLAAHRVVVMGGFIGATEDGIGTTLGRGGSDFTAAIVGAGIGAEEIQIWTDVDGMLTADPRVIPGGHRVRICSFAEAAELAYFGAKVLHPSTVLPAVEKDIPVLILNSRRPHVEGTRIVSGSVHSENVVKAIACKQDISLVNIHSTRMLMAHGFLHRIFEIFDKYETPVDMLATTEVNVSLTTDQSDQLDAITSELTQIAEVSVEKGQAIVSLVGENIRHAPGVAARVFKALEDVNVRMISQGASLLNLSFVVAMSDLKRAVKALHAEFFRVLDPEVFAAS